MKDYLFNDFVVKDGMLYFFSGYFGFIETFDLTTNITSLRHVNRQMVIDSMIIVDDRIYALEMSGKALIIYDIEKNHVTEKKIHCDYDYRENNCALFFRDSSLVIIPRYNNEIIFYNVQTDCLDVRKLDSEEECFLCYLKVQNKVYLFGKETIYTLMFSENSQFEMQKMKISTEVGCVIDCAMLNNDAYVINDKGDIYVIDIRNAEVHKKSSCPFEISGWEKIETSDNRLILLPGIKKQDIYMTDLEMTNWIKYKDYPDDFRYEAYDNWSVFYRKKVLGTETWYSMRSANYILKIDNKTGDITWRKVEALRPKDFFNAVKMRYQYEDRVYEMQMLGLKNLIDVVCL